jgi:LPXTG-motif cell wall-anchored protein
MNNTTKTLLIVGGIALLGIGGFMLYKKYGKDVKGEGEVTPESKKSNKITFTR